MIILGIDPGLANTGWGLIRVDRGRSTCLAYGCVTTTAGEPLGARLRAIHDEISHVALRHSPEECAIESIHFGVNAASAFATGQARGVALLAASQSGIPVAEYAPAQIKSAVVGTGRADKTQVQYMVRAMLGLEDIPRPDHAADALAVALTHAALRMSRISGRRAGVTK